MSTFTAVVVALSSLTAASPESTARQFAGHYRRPTGAVDDKASVAENGGNKANPSTPEKVQLGRQLFFDPRLSASGIVSCATCHNPSFSWGDGLPRAVGDGMKTLGRRTPTILNAGYGGPFMWDGRFDTLEQQALGPITSAAEMNTPAHVLVEKLEAVAGYRAAFAKVFGASGITAENVAQAIAAYERTVVSSPAPFDRWVAGEASALNDSAKRGFVVFNTSANCAKCHGSWRFTDDSFHDIGVDDADRGRGGLADLKDIDVLQHAFKTPTLRNVELRAPYLHDGSAKTLESVIALYEAGGRVARPSLSEDIKPFTLSAAERSDLLAFLSSLNSTCGETLPMLPR